MSHQPQSFNKFVNPSMGQNRTDFSLFSQGILRNPEECESKLIEMQECLHIFKDIIADFELDLKILRTSLIQLSKGKQSKGGQS